MSARPDASDCLRPGLSPVVTVLHVSEATTTGVRRHLIDLVRNTPEVDHHVAVPRRGTNSDEWIGSRLAQAGATVHVVEMRHNPVHPGNVRAAAGLRQLVRKLGPDVVHAHSSVAGAIVRGCVPAGATWRVYSPHAVAAGGAARFVERLLGQRRTDRFIAVSPSEARLARELGLVPSSKLVIIPNGIDLEPPSGVTFDLRSRLHLDPGTPIVGCIARLVRQKAPEQFVRACAGVAHRRPDARFVLVGSGPLRRRVLDQVRDSGLEGRFHHLGSLPESDASAVLAQLDVFVLLSQFEGAPYTPIEAMRAGTPVVLSDVVGNRDVVEDGVSGFLVAFGEAEAAAVAVTRLLDDSDLRRSVTGAALDRLRCAFDVRQMAQSLEHLYLELARSSASRFRLAPLGPDVGTRSQRSDSMEPAGRRRGRRP